MKDLSNYAHRKMVHDALDAGFQLSVHDGEDWVVHLSSDENRIVSDIESVEECTVNFYRESDIGGGWGLAGWAFVVLDTDPFDSVSDYSARFAWLEAWFERGGNEAK